MSIFPSSPENIRKAASILKAGKPVAFPTETVYGLGACATNKKAIEAIYQIKGRPSSNPLIVHVSTLKDVFSLIDKNSRNEVFPEIEKLSHLWPGPLTIVVPKNSVIPDIATAELSSVAIRIPDHPVAQQLLQEAGFPIVAPSANKSEYISPTKAEHVFSCLGGSLEMILDGGSCSIGVESTVLSLLNPSPEILRPGSITPQELSNILEKEVLTPMISSKKPAPSPGLSNKHYAPRTPTYFIDEISPEIERTKNVGLLQFAPSSVPKNISTVRVLSQTGDLKEAALSLYEALRDLDNSALDLILLERCPGKGIACAIQDRLQRAASQTVQSKNVCNI